ncbi:FlgB family protein [Marivita sp.]|uniref:FlgB family protein n=1 Tax=Marivita sp. TaxID=2003365 RepID=UPI0025BB2BD6|nr:FlgB family protein [Marivita sp.]
MFQKLDLFKTAMSMATHAGVKQALTSQNVANADTPGYRAKTVRPFADLVPSGADAFALRATRPQHIPISTARVNSFIESPPNSEPNGNSVVLETEILNSVDAKRQHDRALAVYRASLGMLRGALSKQ